MSGARRRAVLAALAGVAVATPSVLAGRTTPAMAATGDDLYPSNTALYGDSSLGEGVDYARRFRRHGVLDDSLTDTVPFPRTTILALHGGGIEVGTSELCLAIAGYHPATLEVTPSGGPVYDYWMFEGLRSSNNGELHVTASHCDDPEARSLAAGARSALSLHGCTAAQANLASGTQAVLVGGLDTTFKNLLLQEYTAAGIRAIDAAPIEALNGDEPDNIANRTLTGMGSQLEMTTDLRVAMFGENTRAQRKNSTLPLFWTFVNATRRAVARRELAV